ncbi:MAG: hypothetical protein CMC76_07540 [Flavobacteriaceae bacterium]|nr:hypothetical protein [Flavobacteriaceae bacterium]
MKFHISAFHKPKIVIHNSKLFDKNQFSTFVGHINFNQIMPKQISRFLIFISIIFLQSQAHSQNDENLVRATLMDYIEGTSTGEVHRLKRAFHPDAKLYYVQNDTLSERSAEAYIKLFKPGRKNNRPGQIVSINVSKDAAIGVVEVDFPSRKRKYTDYMLLLKDKGAWKIVHKSYTYKSYDRKGKILFVVSNEDSFGENSKKLTGTHYGELVVPYHKFSQAGYEVDFVSPKGGKVALAYFNLQDSLQQKYFYDQKIQHKLKYSFQPKDVNSSEYKAVFYCGGSAPVFDIPENLALQEIAREIYEENEGVVSSVCHGAAGLVNVKLSNGEFLIKGKKMNSFTNNEESNKNLLPFLVESKLKERGAIFRSSDKWQPHVEVDGRLITGQNPASLEKLTDEIIKALNDKTN